MSAQDVVHKLLELGALSESYDTGKHDYRDFGQAFRFEVDGLTVPPDPLFGKPVGGALETTEWARTQLYAKLGPYAYGKGTNKALPKDHFERIDPVLRAAHLNDWMSNVNDKQWLVRCYGTTVRAFLDGAYPTIENTRLIEMTVNLLERDPDLNGIELKRPVLTPDDLHLKILWRDVDKGLPGGRYQIGTYIGNGEIGNRKLRCFPVIQRTACDNSIIRDTGEYGVELVHRGSAKRMMARFEDAIVESLHMGEEVLDEIAIAYDQPIPLLSEVINGLAKQYGWNDKVTDAVKIGTESHSSRMGVVNGVTYAAHTAVEDPNDQIEMEILGGRILAAPGSLFADAARHADSYNAEAWVPFWKVERERKALVERREK